MYDHIKNASVFVAALFPTATSRNTQNVHGPTAICLYSEMLLSHKRAWSDVMVTRACDLSI